MKAKLLSMIASLLLVTPTSAMDAEMKEAIQHGAMAKICYQVVDDEGMPVSNVTAHVWFSSYARHQDDADWLVSTDSNGTFVVEHRTNESLDCGFDKEGYYHSSDQILFREREVDGARVANGKWLPYGETRRVVLKKIRNPVQIGEFGRCSIPIPIYDKWVGFDLEKRMWTPPYGDGRFSDVLLKFGRYLVDRQTDFRMTMEVSFTNNPYAGCYLLNYDESSERKNVYHADEGAVYAQEMNYVQERHPGSLRNDNRFDKGSYLIFRTRTRLDDEGQLVSAHYGVIGGRWSFYGTMLSGGFLFNPNPNDTNLEDAETARKSRLRYKQRLEFERQRKANVK